MGRYLQKSVGRRLGLTLAVMVLLLALSWLVAGVAMDRARAGYQHTVVRTDALSDQAFVMTKAMLDQETGWRAYLVTDDSRFLEPYYAGRRTLPAAYAQAEQLADDPQDRLLLRQMMQRAGAWERWVRSEIAIWRAGGLDQVRSDVSAGTGKRLFDEFRIASDGTLRHIQREREAELSSGSLTFHQANVLLGSIMLCAIVAVLLLGTRLHRSIVEPLQQLREAAGRIRHGHFDTPVPHEGKDETAQLAADMDTMRDHLDARHQLASLLASTLELEKIYPDFAAGVKRLVPYDRLSITLIDEGGTTITTAYAEGLGTGVITVGTSRPIETTVTSQAVRAREPVVCRDLETVSTDERFSDEQAVLEAGIRCVLVVPLMTKGKVVGTLNLGNRQPDVYDEGTVATLFPLVQPLANAVENAELYHEISEANAELIRASESKSEFLANMSHELRTPLNAIIGFSEVLQDETFGPLNDRQQRYVGNVLQSGRHLLDLVNDILDISKVEAGRMELHREDLNLNELLLEVGERMTALYHNKKVDLQVETDRASPVISADRGRFVQIMLNLLSNAIKFTPSGGTVRVGYEAHDDAVAIAVTDSGIGIAPEDQERIFEEFEQVDSSEARKQQGTGLGLTLTKRLVELHDGTIGVESEPGKGSTFTITLLRVARVAPIRGIRGDVLVVEDDPAARELLSVYLMEAGYGVQTIDRLAHVMTRARQVKPVAITLDLAFQNELAWQALRELKSHPETRNIPVIIVSILDEQQKGSELGADAYLTKPIARHELVETLGRVIRESAEATEKNLRVLVVEDDPKMLELIALALEHQPYQVTAASSGTDALKLLQERPLDALIVDLKMGPPNGFDVIEAARADPLTRDIPILVLTETDLRRDQLTRLEGRVEAILAKGGVSMRWRENLLWELQRATRGKRPGAQTHA